MPGQLQRAGDGLEDAVREHQPGEVHLARADGGHLPVEDADRLEVAVEHVADPGVAPAEHRVGAGRDVGLEPREAALDERGRPAVGDREVVPGPGPRQVAAQRRVPGGVRVQERERGRGVGDAVQPGDHRHGAVLQPPLLLGARVEQPVVAEVVGQHIGRHHALDPVHQEERRAEHVAGRLHPPDRRHRHVAVLGRQPHGVELVLQPVRREDGHVLGGRGHSGDELALAPLALLGPRGVQDQGLGRHPVGRDAGVQGHRRLRAVRQLGGQPLGERLRDVRRCRGWTVASRSLPRGLGSLPQHWWNVF